MWTPCWAIHKLVSQGSPANHFFISENDHHRVSGVMAMVYMWVKIYEEVKGRRKRVKVAFVGLQAGSGILRRIHFAARGGFFLGTPRVA